ncbi:MAG TPA: SIS domain-containing protein [Candidatus Binatia bacterium]|nr:SIS domain-containing protein [Candidatus Binatia bacterium]
MDSADRYFDVVIALLQRLRTSQHAAIAAAADAVATCLSADGLVHLFGTGHSHMLAAEVFYRAGGLIPIDAMLDPSVVLSGGAQRSTATERTPGAAAAIATRYDLRAGDVGIVISNSGRNPAPIEMAQLMKARGVRVIAVTSVAHSSALPAVPPHAQRLFEIVDIVLDNGGAYGDAALRVPGVAQPVGPTSTITGAALLHAVMIGAMERLVGAGQPVINLPSGNVPDADLTAVMTELARYRGRIRHW